MKSEKPSGMRVWKMYEQKSFDGIRARTAAEVNDAVAITGGIIKRCKS
jgi:hypothetical protein